VKNVKVGVNLLGRIRTKTEKIRLENLMGLTKTPRPPNEDFHA